MGVYSRFNFADFIIHFYEKLYERRYANFLFTPIRRFVRALSQLLMDKALDTSSINYAQAHSEVIVSFTSFPARIDKIDRVVKCMLRQTVLPRKIILWLSKDQFGRDHVQIPEKLSLLTGEIFEIRMVDGDIRSHKKYLYSFKEFPDNEILLIDDDIYYPSNMIETLLEGKRKYPDSVICRYGSVMGYNTKGRLAPYNIWWNETNEETSDPNFFLGTGGGTLVTPSLLYKDTTNIELAWQLCPLADDVWINAMINLSGLEKHKIKSGLLLQVSELQSVALKYINVTENQNDKQIESVRKYYINNIGVDPFRKR